MKARQIKIDRQELGKLKDLAVHYEKVVDGLDEEGLEAAENDLQKRIHSILQKSPSREGENDFIPKIENPEIPLHRRKPVYWKAGLLLAAAAALFSIRSIIPDSPDANSNWATKGSGSSLAFVCESQIMQTDRSTLENQSSAAVDTYFINTNLETFLRIDCNQRAFVHLAERTAEGWHWLVRNQPFQRDFIRNAETGEPLNLTPRRGSELRLIVSQNPDVDPAGAADVWSESFQLRAR